MSEAAEAQRRFLTKVYSRIAERYRLANSVLTFGLDAFWRRRAAALALKHLRRRASAARPSILDLCTGTGEMAGLLTRKADSGALVVGMDLSPEMLSKAAGAEGPGGLRLVRADTEDLPFPGGTFDLVTMGFAMRNNAPDSQTLALRLEEVARVLRPGGIFVNLETSQPSSPAIRSARDLFVRLYAGPVGGALAGDRAGFAYLAGSIQRFYGPEELSGVLEKAGFEVVEVERLLFGVAAVHVCMRP